jgi:hypothetical protein
MIKILLTNRHPSTFIYAWCVDGVDLKEQKRSLTNFIDREYTHNKQNSVDTIYQHQKKTDKSLRHHARPRQNRSGNGVEGSAASGHV